MITMPGLDTASAVPSVFVIGSCGLIDSHLIEFIVAEDTSCEVRVIDSHIERNLIPGVM